MILLWLWDIRVTKINITTEKEYHLGNMLMGLYLGTKRTNYGYLMITINLQIYYDIQGKVKSNKNYNTR